MGKIHVLVVDDSVVVRRMVSNVLTADPDIQVVGTAANGKIALSKIAQVNPDIITLDLEMPEMDGLQVLAQIRKTHPRLPVIIFSSLTERGGAATLDALTLGANDYVTKPANVASANAAMQRVRDELIPKIKSFCGRSGLSGANLLNAGQRRGSNTACPPREIRSPFSLPPPVEIVAIGASTGGPNALAELLPLLPDSFPIPLVIVQHMPPVFTRLMAERLNCITSIRVQEAATGDQICPQGAWIAPGDYHMVVQRQASATWLRLHQGPPENSCRPAVDVLFRSAAEVYGAGTLAVMLTGMGQDGLRGCQAVRDAGGQIVVQDEASSVVWGMPGCVARAGLADRILSLSEIAAEIVRMSMASRFRSSTLNVPARA